MKPQKRCVYCRQLFSPYAARYRRQKACSKKECQREIRRATNRTYRHKNPYDADYRRAKKKAWTRENGKVYMRRYRKDHPVYVKRNRRQQHRRDRKKGNLVKKDL